MSSNLLAEDVRGWLALVAVAWAVGDVAWRDGVDAENNVSFSLSLSLSLSLFMSISLLRLYTFFSRSQSVIIFSLNCLNDEGRVCQI